MDVRVSSIKRAKEDLKEKNTNNIKAIIVSSFDNDIDCIDSINKLVLHFEDITTLNNQSFNKALAKKINEFVKEIDFEKYKLYVCCDSGVSRSSAIVAAILRKHKKNEKIIWTDYNYKPNVLVYKILCEEFGLKNSKIRIKYLEYINNKALKTEINKSRHAGIFTLIKRLQSRKYIVDKF